MNVYEYVHFVLFVFGFVAGLTQRAYGESSTCLTVYKEGGAPAVFQSPKCPRWKLPDYGSRPRSPTIKCQSAMLQGRRNTQEDRTLCAFDIRIPFPGLVGVTEVTAGIAAIFDGHNGVEASEMASKLLLEYFTLHTYFLLDTIFAILLKNKVGRLPSKQDLDFVSTVLGWDEELEQHVVDFGRYKLSLSTIIDGSIHLEVLKKSLLRAINDIDATFSKEAHRKNLDSGSTATVVLIADGQILVANVGDSKAFLCSEIYQAPADAKATLLRLYKKKRQDGVVMRIKDSAGFKQAVSSGWEHFSAKELTRDHHLDRDDERSRVESTGGHVLEWGGVSRVNGQLTVTRAIGDLRFKSYGVISVPEVTDWQPLTANDSYLVAASDGVFEKLSPQDVCDILWELHTHEEDSTSCRLYSLAECIVNAAYEKGSMDNMAAVLIPFKSTAPSQCLLNQRCDRVGKLALGQKHIDEWAEMEDAHPVISKFDRLLVEDRHSRFGCFYLYKNLNEDDYTPWIQKDSKQNAYDSLQVSSHALDHYYGQSLNFYNDQNMCLHFGLNVNGDRDQCRNPEGFVNFLGLLESIPIHNTGTDHGSSEQHTMPDPKYMLKRRFGRGSYGEVWLAFNWNCSNGTQASSWSLGKDRFACNNGNHGPDDENQQQRSSFAHDYSAGGHPDDNMFILKRIMVERGTSVYLSGLREKYFGEIFLNASSCLGVSSSAPISESFQKYSASNIHDFLKTKESIAQEDEGTWSFENIFTRSGARETSYEGGLNHIARYIESFESQSNEIWLVFCHEGVSLSKLLYTAEEIESSADEDRGQHAKRIQVLHPSKWWHWMKTTEAGQEEMRYIIWQLLMALKSCHNRNITHRDIKPENMIICFEDQDSGRCSGGIPAADENYATRMRIIDFGSAIDEFTMKHLYGSGGPSRAEQTHEYTPPEALLNASWYRGPTSSTLKYDMWSVGVVILELILGSPDVFQISALTRALLDQYIKGWNDGLKELAYKLRSYMELCILVPGSSVEHHHLWSKHKESAVSPASWKCSEEFFSNLIKSRDPLKIGFPNVLALRLVRQLLLWHPEARLSVDDALRHPYFSPSPQCGRKI